MAVGQKTKTALIPKRDEGCLKSSVVPPKLQKCRRGAPAALCAVTLRSVRFVSPEAPGWRKKCSAGTPFSQGRSLWAAAHILLAPSLPFAIITIHAQRACCSFASISDYSIVRPFVNGFSKNPAASCESEARSFASARAFALPAQRCPACQWLRGLYGTQMRRILLTTPSFVKTVVL